MKKVNKSAAKVLDVLTRDVVDISESVRFGKPGGPFMPVHVSRLADNVYSVAHYFEANGDLVPDPDVEFLHDDGDWYPIAIVMQFGRREVVELDASSRPIRFHRKGQADLASFANTWMGNIKHQQGLDLKSASRASAFL